MGVGTRVNVDTKKLEEYAEIFSWFFKLRPKKEQNTERLTDEIRSIRIGILHFTQVQVVHEFIGKHEVGKTDLCSFCGEAYTLLVGD